jgi:hypothetical protein
MRFHQNDWNMQPMEVDGRPPLSPQMMEVDSTKPMPMHMHVTAQVLPPHPAFVVKPKKSVTFAHEAMVYRSTSTEEDVKSLWYSKDELAEFKSERRDMIRVIKKVNFDLARINQEVMCLRGYEPYFSLHMNKTTKCARKLVINIVLLEQQRQRMMASFDAEALRIRCGKASQWAREIALELGNTDALLNPLRLEFLEQLNQPCNFVNLAQLRISSVDEKTVQQVESALGMVNSMLNEC